MTMSASPPSTSATGTVQILQDYVESLARVRDEEEDDPQVSFDHSQQKRRELAQTCLARLNQARTQEIGGILEEAMRALKGQGVLSDMSAVSGDDLRAVLAASSQPMAELLRRQLVSQEEAGLYGVCRIAWDHAYVGEQVVDLLEEVRQREREQLFKRQVEGVERGLVVIGAHQNDLESIDDDTFIGALQRGVVENLQRLVAAREDTSHGDGDGMDRREIEGVDVLSRDQREEKRRSREETIRRLHEQVRKTSIECLVDSVVFEKGGLPKPRHAARLAALFGSVAAVDDLGRLERDADRDMDGDGDLPYDTPVKMAAGRLAELVFTSSVRKVLVTFGDAAKHPVGYREKVILRILTCLKDEVLPGNTVWVPAVGRSLWHMIANWYMEELDRREQQGAMENDSSMMKRMVFAKKLESKTMMLFGIGHDGGHDDRSSLAAVFDERVREMMNRRRSTAVCAVRDALFGIGAERRHDDDAAYREIGDGDVLFPWLAGGPGESSEAGESDGIHPQSTLGTDVLDELRSLDRDTPLGLAETRLLVLESHATAVSRIWAALQDNSALLTEGQYAHFMETLAEDVYSLLVALVRLRTSDTEGSIEALPKASLRYTSCLYMARALCMMRFGSGTTNSCTKIVNTPLPTLDNACRRIVMLAQREILGQGLEAFQQEYLVEHLDSLTSWRQGVDIQDIIAKKKSVSRLLHAFGQLSKGMAVTSQAMAASIMTRLVEWLAETVADSILDLRDISEELSETVPQVLDDLCEGLGGFVKPSHQKAGRLERLRQLCRIMRMTSKDIVTEWLDGVLGQLFDKEEIISLIGALFEPTPLVRENLARL